MAHPCSIVARTLASLSLIGLTSLAIAAPPVDGVSLPEPDETESNDRLADRDFLPGGNDSCKFNRSYLGHLGDYDPNQPDTAVCVTTFELGCDASNDDGDGFDLPPGVFSRWGGSSALFIQPALGFPGDWAPIPRIAVSGKGSYEGFSTLPADHGQVGLFELYVEFYDDFGTFISREVFEGELTGGDSEVVFTNIPIPPATRDFDVIVNPLAEENGDIDFYELNGLRPFGFYYITVRGINSRSANGAPLDTILTAWTTVGSFSQQNDDICNAVGCGTYDPGSRLIANTGPQGRLLFSVSGFDDFNSDGLSDSNGWRHRETGTYTITVTHTCGLGCADIDGNCQVDFGDLDILLDRWGQTCFGTAP